MSAATSGFTTEQTSRNVEIARLDMPLALEEREGRLAFNRQLAPTLWTSCGPVA